MSKISYNLETQNRYEAAQFVTNTAQRIGRREAARKLRANNIAAILIAAGLCAMFAGVYSLA